MVIIFIKIMVRPEKRKELSQTLQAIVDQLRETSGCLRADFYQDVKSEDGFFVVEEWATEKDADDHLRSDIFTVLIGAGSLMHQPPEITFHTVSRSTKWKG